MEHSVKSISGKKFVEAAIGFRLSGEQDALDIAAYCWENETENLLLNHGNLPDEFFNLRTGLAGAALQKFSNYRIKAAAVVDPLKIKGRFNDLVRELNRGGYFRVFEKRTDAESWLLKF
jgi:PadR family transcriptional regulator, regulatory protein AphA